ncbi:MAG: hypothetical protein A4E61_00690 [Syntrophorhabdus sp. PtaB.Bin184]|nr:MAG: hypothetical protein A4E61_00690 [Syntrophorhabdus sp. PtaB.Bin184]
MFLYREGHLVVLSLDARVDASHRSLQLGELPDHVGDEVRLHHGDQPFEFSGDPVVDDGRQVSGYGLYPFHLVLEGAEFDMEDDGGKPFVPVGEIYLHVLVEEETRVGKAGAEHLLVSPYDVRVIFRGRVGEEYEVRQEPSRGIFDGNVPLVALHDVDEDLLRDIEVHSVEGALEGIGVFGDVEDLPHELLVPERLSARCFLDAGDPLPYDLHALVLVHHNVVLPQGVDVFEGMTYPDRAGREKTVAPACGCARDIGNGERDGRAPEEAEQPLDRACVFKAPAAPAHLFLEGDAGDDVGQQDGEHLHGGDPFFLLLDGHEFHAVLDALREVADLDTLGTGEADGGLGGVSRFVECPVIRRAELDGDGLGLLFRDVLNEERHAPGGRLDVDVAEADPRAGEGLADEGRKPLLRGREKARRYFLRAYLQKQKFAHDVSSLPCSRRPQAG